MIIGHKTQWQLLKKLAEGGRVPQALLFTGEDSLGKKKVASEFVKILNCQEKAFSKKPCQVCQSCLLVGKGKHPDFIVIEPQIKDIQISQIRELKRQLSLKPQLALFKTVLIDQAAAMRPEAQHCLLKTLEEPKGRVLFILTSAKPAMLFGTIRSRCEILKFYKIPSAEIAEILKPKAEPEQLGKILELADGRPGIALSLLAAPQKIKEYEQRIREVANILSLNLPSRFQYVKALAENAESLGSTLDIWLRYFKARIIPFLEGDSQFSAKQLPRIIEAVEATQFLLSSTNINVKLALEVLMLELP